MYYFFLGNTPDLSRLELDQLLDSPSDLLTNNIASTDTPLPLNLTKRLGGTKKISQELARFNPIDLESALIDLLKHDKRKNVAITSYTSSPLSLNLYSIKTVVAQSRPIRFVSMDTTEHELVMLSKQHVFELNLHTINDQIAVSQTIWIFDAHDWLIRDRAKPYRSIKKGMLPPKLARIMVNLALGNNNQSSLYDPFCGTGTILSEALLVGSHSVFGSDTSPNAVTGSESNLKWQIEIGQIKDASYNLKLADATHPPYSSVDCIATEPYMGPLIDERNALPIAKIKDIARGLDKLYRGSLRAWHSILPNRGRVVISIPSFQIGKYSIQTISIDTACSLGYNYISSVAYGKPGATVIRNITILEKDDSQIKTI